MRNFLIALLLWPLAAFASDSLNVALVGGAVGCWNEPADLVVRENFAVVPSGFPGLRVMDITDVYKPV